MDSREKVAWWEVTVPARGVCYTTKDAQAAERVSRDDGAEVRSLIYGDLHPAQPGRDHKFKLWMALWLRREAVEAEEGDRPHSATACRDIAAAIEAILK